MNIEINNVKVLKSGIWYMAANFITKGLVFLSTPIFARLLTHEEYGLFSNYMSWLVTFQIIMSLNLGASFISAKYDFCDVFDSYVSSSTLLCVLSFFVWLIVINIIPTIFSSLTGINIRHLNIMIVYLLFTSIIDLFQTRERFYYEYKTTVIISLISSAGSTILSILLVYIMNDKLEGRIIGNSIVNIVIGGVLTLIIIYKGKRVSFNHWRYALPICLPYIPHLLSLTLLNSADRIMITKICGAEDNALYSLAYSCGAIITILVTSMNTAFSPWLGDRLKKDEKSDIRDFSKFYISGFCFCACGMMLIAPELLYLMGGTGYSEAIYVMPPVAFGFVCQFLYTMYVNIEQFAKKTIGMAFASISAAILNVLLNWLFIYKYGYIAAAYTTAIGFFWLLIIHIVLVYKLGYCDVYNNKVVTVSLLLTGIFCVLVNYTYILKYTRYCLIGIWIIILFVVLGKNFPRIVGFLKK